MWPRPARQDRPDLEQLAARSGGAQLVGYGFSNKELSFQIFHEGLGGLLAFHVPTDTVHARSVPDDPRRAACRLELSPLDDRLAVRDGRYAPPADPDRLLSDARGRLTLAYGRRASEYRWLLRLRGDYPLLACLVRDLAEVTWTVE